MRAIFLTTLLCLAPVAALADDSSAALAAGGLVLTKQADIRMASEDLFISPKQVRVRYAFVNDGKSDVDTIVAFPLPDIDVERFYFEPLGTTLQATPNFMGFALTVDGKPVKPQVEERAFYKGRDVGAIAKKAGLPLNLVGTDMADRLEHLPKPARDMLMKEGLMDADEPTVHWTTSTKFWWHQTFPAGKTVVVEHRYQPVTGQSFFGDSDLVDKQDGTTNVRDYCIDAGTAAAIRARTAKLDEHGQNGKYLQAYRTDFVLKTANNWKGPIGKFRLTVDKLKPSNVLSLCWDGELKKTGATTFEAARDNLAPARDISLLVLE
jgi:Domain of unknown function (DUF4424)